MIDGLFDFHQRLLVIDAAEKVENLDSDKSLYYGILALMVKRGWRIVITVRTRYFDMLMKHLELYLEDCAVKHEELAPLSANDLHKVEEALSVRIPYENITSRILSIPFYLNLFLRDRDGYQKAGLSNFKQATWELVVQGGKSADAAADCFQQLIISQVQSRTCWLDVSGIPGDALTTLVGRGVLSQDARTRQYRVTHDVYEEIALEHQIESIAISTTADEFFERLPRNRSAVRAFRLWMRDKLYTNSDAVKGLIRRAFEQKNQCWLNETLLATITSSFARQFLADSEVELFADKAKKLHQILNLVRCACKEPRADIPFSFKANDLSKYYFAKPSGESWSTLVEFICDHCEKLYGFDLAEIISFVQEWAQVNSTGTVARKAGLLAMRIALHDEDGGKQFETHYDSWENLAKIITSCSKEIHNELRSFIEFTLKDFDPATSGIQRDIYNGVLCQPHEHINFIKEFPELTRRMAFAAWFAKKDHYYSSEWADEVFGLNDRFAGDHGISSAYKTPVYLLLQYDFQPTLKFIIDVVNKAVCHAAKWKNDDIGIVKTTIVMPSGKLIEQYISPALWAMHRGAAGPVTPHLLQSIHMALEKFVLECHSTVSTDKQSISNLEQIALRCIENSNSASITGALTSLVLAHPNEYFSLATVVLSSREMIQMDHLRGIIYEGQCSSLYSIYCNHEFFYAFERNETLKDQFRSETLESIMLKYQFNFDDCNHQRRNLMFKFLDEYGKSERDEDRFFVLRCDSRKQRIEKSVDKKGRNIFHLVPNVPVELEKRSVEAREKVLPNHLSQSLMLWGAARLKGEPVPESIIAYEENPNQAMHDFENVYDLAINGDPRLDLPSALPYAASAFLYFYADCLSLELKSKCEQLLLEFSKMILQDGYRISALDGVDVAIAALPILIASKNKGISEAAQFILLVAMLGENEIGMSSRRMCDTAFEAIRRNDSPRHTLTARYLPSYIFLRTRFQKFVNSNAKRRRLFQVQNWLSLFVRENENVVADALATTDIDVEDLIKCSDALPALGNAILLINPTSENAERYKELIVGGIYPVLNGMYCIDEDSGRLDTKHLSAYATQYQHKLAKLLLLMKDKPLEDAIKELQNVNLLCWDRWFLSALLCEEDGIGEHDNFWRIWRALIPNLAHTLSRNPFMQEFDNNGVIETLFLGKSNWKSNGTKWKSFKDADISFYSEAVSAFPPALGVLTALASFCNGIGGAYWAEILELIVFVVTHLPENHYRHERSMKSAIQSLETFCFKAVSENAERIKSCNRTWKNMMVVLDWLVDWQSNLAYQLREQLI